MKYLLDTHAWIWWHIDPQKLSKKVRYLIADPNKYNELLLSSITIWEFCKLIEKGRLGISCNPLEWIIDALNMVQLRIVPLTPSIAYKSTTLKESPFTDPADQIIIATAIEEDAVLITKDVLMGKYKHVKTLWTD